MVESNRQLLTRPGALAGLPAVGVTAAGMPLATRVAFTSNGPTTVLPSLRGVAPRATLAASGPPAMAAGASSSGTLHKAEKRKYDSLR